MVLLEGQEILLIYKQQFYKLPILVEKGYLVYESLQDHIKCPGMSRRHRAICMLNQKLYYSVP